MQDENHVGLGPYAAQGAGSAPQRLLAKLLEKTNLRAALQAIQSEIDAAIPTLNAAELQELQTLMAAEIVAADADVEALRAQVEQEAVLAQTTRPMQIKIPRQAAAVLAAEVERRIARGVYPSAESLVGEAVAKAFAGGHP